MSMSLEQRQDIVIWTDPYDPGLRIISGRSKHNRRYRMIVALDGDQILREWWPGSYDHLHRSRQAARDWCIGQARSFLEGYRMARAVWSSGGPATWTNYSAWVPE